MAARLANNSKQQAIREITWLLRRLVQAGECYTKQLHRSCQLSAHQLVCLVALFERGPMPPSHIAKHVLVTSSTVTGIIDRLERKGLVQRLRNSADRRVVLIQLTEAGSRLAAAAPAILHPKILEALTTAHPSEVQAVVHALRLLVSRLDFTDAVKGSN